MTDGNGLKDGEIASATKLFMRLPEDRLERRLGLSLITTIRDRDATISNLHLYLQLVLDVAADLETSVTDLIGLRANHPKHPELDTEEARAERGWRVIPKAAQATERYARVVNGENSGCLEGDETDEDRQEFLEAINILRKVVAELKGEPEWLKEEC